MRNMAVSGEGRIVVAMSGGVDSSVAAMLLADQGHDILGISMQVWDYRNNGGSCRKATCCAPDDFTDARKVAHAIGIPYYVFDFERTFRSEVIDRFVQSYHEGKTPNPCIDCNNRVKFRELRDRALSMGCEKVATGHYARIEKSERGWHLLRGSDPLKDQSYFLYGLSQAELARTVFPVGDMTKEEVRELARSRGLATASKPESQDICFVSGSVQDFVARIGGGRKGGAIVTKDGRKVGEHDGIHRFTVGQRRGLGVGGNENPVYVVELDAENDRVIVGSKEDLEQDGFAVGELNFVSPALAERLAALDLPFSFECVAQLRHRHAGVPVRMEVSAAGARAIFLGGWTTVSPGQAAVFYDTANREVLGGGRILR